MKLGDPQTSLEALVDRIADVADDRAGFVYFIADTGAVKIGLALDPLSRLEDLQVGNPRRLRIVSWFPGGQASEQFLHLEFFEYRIRGEWFDLGAPGLRELAEWFAALRRSGSSCCHTGRFRGRCVECGRQSR